MVNMRNRAKCKKCASIIESFTLYDYVDCKCGEINIYGGKDKLGCSAKDWVNFLRIDDLGNEILVQVKENNQEIHQPSTKPTQQEILETLTHLINSYENLPSHAMQESPTNYDLCAVLLIMRSLFERDLVTQ